MVDRLIEQTAMTESPDRILFTHVVLAEVVGSLIVGVLAGVVAGHLLKWAERANTIENSSFITFSVALSITVLGMAKLLGTDGVLAVFVAGLAFGNVIGGQQRAKEDNLQEAINRFFTLPIFTLLGMMIPSLKNLPEAFFVGWFGPIGVAAIFYAGYCLRHTGLEEVWLVCSLMVCASVVVHSLSSTPLTRLYGKYARQHGLE